MEQPIPCSFTTWSLGTELRDLFASPHFFKQLIFKHTGSSMMIDLANALTRRSALGLMSAAGAAGLVAAAQPAVAGVADPPPESLPKFIFGYGSLIQIESRTRTVPSAFAAAPAFVKGITRGWYYQADSPSLNPTYLGAVDEAGATTNGVIYPVTDSEFEATKLREADYLPTKIDQSAITMLDGSLAPPKGEIWYFASKTKKTATLEHPIVQSYVDICVDGCLEIEAMYPLAEQAGFAEQFIRTCTDWKTPWMNDRIYPWRPFIYMPRASKIDALLRKVLGDDLFNKITVK
jgi:hypothetical protein